MMNAAHRDEKIKTIKQDHISELCLKHIKAGLDFATNLS